MTTAERLECIREHVRQEDSLSCDEGAFLLAELDRLRGYLTQIALKTELVSPVGAYNICGYCSEEDGDHRIWCPIAIARAALGGE